MAPSFVAFGAAIGGPVGALAGGIISGIISTGIVEFLGDVIWEAGDWISDLIWGEDEGQRLKGSEKNDVIRGGKGDDSIDCLGGDDFAQGGEGDDCIYGGDGTDYLHGLSGNDHLYGDNGDDRLYGGTGDDRLGGGAGNDFLAGMDGNDELNGDDGDDYLNGGAGNDILAGGDGKDIYYFDEKWGHDIIDNEDESSGRKEDKIVFGEGICPDDIILMRNGYNLLLIDNKRDNSICVKNAYSYEDGTRMIDNIQFADGTVWGIEDIKTMVQAYGLHGTDEQNIIRGGSAGYGYDPSESIFGYGEADSLYGEDGDDMLYGGADNDHLYGGDGDDYLIGGTGNDNLEGGKGKDTYYFEQGDGSDWINNEDPETWMYDRIAFGEGIRPEDIMFSRDEHNLYFDNKTTGDRVIVRRAYDAPDGRYFIGGVVFSDGTVWTGEWINEQLRHYEGTDGDDWLRGYDTGYGYNTSEIYHGGAGNDVLVGNNGDDVLYGEDGRDQLEGGAGNDYLEGGTGDDNLNGGSGRDIYYFNLGDGKDIVINEDATDWMNDKIVFGEGILPEDIKLSRDERNVYLTNESSGDRIDIHNAYRDSSGNSRIGSVEYADGTVWSWEQINEALRHYEGTDGDDWLKGYDTGYGYNTSEEFHGGAGRDVIVGNKGDDYLYGEEGDDQLQGGDGNDYLDGGTGDDKLYGGSGDDTYVFGQGYGIDRIIDNSGCNTIRFREDVSVEDFVITKNGDDMEIAVNDQGDRLVLDDYFCSTGSRNNSCVFADGLTLDDSGLQAIMDGTYDYEAARRQAQLLVEGMASMGSSDAISDAGTYTAPEAATASGVQMWVTE